MMQIKNVHSVLLIFRKYYHQNL